MIFSSFISLVPNKDKNPYQKNYLVLFLRPSLNQGGYNSTKFSQHYIKFNNFPIQNVFLVPTLKPYFYILGGSVEIWFSPL